MKKQTSLEIEVLRQKLASGSPHQLTVVSDSMSPLIAIGEDIVVHPRPAKEDLKIFDIILFYQGGRLNAHFLTKIDWQGDTFITRPLKDPRHQDYPLQYQDILGIIKNKKLNWWHKLKVLASSL